MKRYFQIIMLSAIAAVTSCSDNKSYETSICALADISGTYASQKSTMVKIIKAGLLPRLSPGDGFFFIAIGSNSYTKKSLISKMTLDYRPTEANRQKMSFSKTLDKFVKGKKRSRHTDISGAMMLCADYLRDTKSGTQLIFVFSDMKEELPRGVKRKFKKDEFAGMDIAAMNVIRLGKDKANPEVYRKRLAQWEQKLSKAGAKSWKTILDATKITEYLDNIKS